MDNHDCPYCKKPCTKSEGRLDQSGETYLPTTVWSCMTCEYRRWDGYKHTGETNPWKNKYA